MGEVQRSIAVIRVSDESFPLICLQSFGRLTQAELDAVKPVYFRAYERKQPLLFVSDVRLASHGIDQRRLWADWSDESAKADVNKCVKATVLLLDSPLLRGALTALHWISPPVVPVHVERDVLTAIETARSLVDTYRMSVPSNAWGHVRYWLESGSATRAG
jgi:hypothetical protein